MTRISFRSFQLGIYLLLIHIVVYKLSKSGTMQPTSVNRRLVFKGFRKSNHYRVMGTFFKILQVLCCLDFGFFEPKSKNQRVLYKFSTVLNVILSFSICVCLIVIENSNSYFILGCVFFMTRFLLNVIILLFFNQNKTFNQLHRDLQYIDTKLGVENAAFIVEYKILLSIVVNAIFFCILGVSTYPFSNIRESIISSFLIRMNISYSVVYMTCTFVFYSIHCRLNIFTSALRKRNIFCIYPMQLLYKAIADLTEEYKSALDSLLITSLVFTTIEVMGNVLFIVDDLKYFNAIEFGLDYVGLFIHLVSMFAPALYAEKIASRANDVKLILHDKLSNEEDSSRQCELERFIRYLEARPLRFRVYRVIPLDASLLGMVLNFIVTYLIVILQFMFKK